MGDRADSDNIYLSSPPKTFYVLVLTFVQDQLTDMNSKQELFDTKGKMKFKNVISTVII